VLVDCLAEALSTILLAFVIMQRSVRSLSPSPSANEFGMAPKTRTPGWLARLHPCYSSVGSDWFTSLVPADLFKLFGSAPLRTAIRARLLDQSQTFQLPFQNRQRTP
jgi:hypothetical protein